MKTVVTWSPKERERIRMEAEEQVRRDLPTIIANLMRKAKR